MSSGFCTTVSTNFLQSSELEPQRGVGGGGGGRGEWVYLTIPSHIQLWPNVPLTGAKRMSESHMQLGIKTCISSYHRCMCYLLILPNDSHPWNICGISCT